MSRANIELLRRSYDAFNRGDLDAAFEILGPDLEWLPPEEAPTAGTYRGSEGAKAEVTVWTEPFDDFRWEIKEIVDAGEHILVRGLMSGRGKSSGVEVNTEEFHVWTVSGERPVRMQMFLDKAKALAAAGLEQ